MKSILLLIMFVGGCSFYSFAQAASKGKLEYQRGEKVAAVIELPYSTDIVEGAIRKRLQSATVKEERLKGLQVFKGGRVTSTDGEMVDFYFKADRKGRKEDSASVLYLILGRPGENVALRNLNDEFRITDAQRFLDNLVPEIASFKLETDITEQDEMVRKSEKNLINLSNNQKDLEKRISELQEKLAQNKRDQETQNTELNKQKTLRDALLSKRGATKK